VAEEMGSEANSQLTETFPYPTRYAIGASWGEVMGYTALVSMLEFEVVSLSVSGKEAASNTQY